MQVNNMTIKQIEKYIFNIENDIADTFLLQMSNDKRTGVLKLLKRYNALQDRIRFEEEKANKMVRIEKSLWEVGYSKVAGIDEVGRGPLAGPVVAACVILPEGIIIKGVDDSKKLSEKIRNELYDIIMDKALAVGLGRIAPDEIDRINIYNATKKAMIKAVEACSVKPQFLLIDAMNLHNMNIKQKSIIKGDSLSQSIAAASIIAKVTRDREMQKWHDIYPEYDFYNNKGYGTKTHIYSIKRVGLSKIHRKSFTTNMI